MIKLLCIHVVILLVGIAPEVQTQTTQSPKNRVVFWLKGIGAEEDGLPGWKQYDSLFTVQRYMRGFQPGYTSDRPIDNIGSQMIPLMETLRSSVAADASTSLSPSPIVITHSMGGLVARSVERLNRNIARPQSFGGIITVGAPHLGIDMVNATDSGIVDEFLARSALTISRATPILLQGITSFVAELDNLFPNYFNNAARRFFRNRYNKGQADPCVDDMKPGSPYLTALNQPNQPGDDMPMISIYGVAYFPTFYRTVSSSTIRRPHLDPIDAHKDDSFVVIMNNYAATFRTIARNLADPNLTLFDRTQGYTDFRLAFSLEERRAAEEDLNLAARTLQYDLPVGMSVFLGSAKFQYVDGDRFIRDVNAEDGTPSFRLETIHGLLPIITEEDDGALRRETAIHPNRTKVFRALGANHISLQNHRSVRLAIDNIFQTDPEFRVFERKP